MRMLVSIAAVVVALSTPAWGDRAAALNKQGIRAAERNDWELARQRFEQSYALDPRPLVLLNLAGAQEHTNKLIAARNSFQTFLELTAKSRDRDMARFRKAAKQGLAELATAIPTLQIRALGLGSDGVVELDGRTMDIALLVKPVAVDPGDHKILIVRRGEAIARREIALARGERKEVEIAAPLSPGPIRSTPPPPDDAELISIDTEEKPVPAPIPQRRDDRGGSSKWLWGLAAVLAVGAGAAAGYYYVLYEPPPADPTQGTLGGGVIVVP